MVFWITQKKITRNSLAVHVRSMSGLVRYAIVDASVRCLLCWPSSHLVQTNPEKSLPAFSSLVIADRARSRVSEKLLQLRILDLRNLQLLRIRHVYAAVFRTAAESDTHGANALPDANSTRFIEAAVLRGRRFLLSNVSYGSEADVSPTSDTRPLLARKQTCSGRPYRSVSSQ